MAPRPRPQGGRQPRQQQPQVLSNLQSLLLHAAPTLPQYSQVRGRLAACGLPRSSPASFCAPLPPACLTHLPDRPALQLGELDHPSSSSGGAYFTLQDLWCALPLAVCCQIGRLVTVGRSVQLACPPCRPTIGVHALSAACRRRLPFTCPLPRRRPSVAPACRQSYEAWSAYGCEVPMRINVDGVWQEVRPGAA